MGIYLPHLERDNNKLPASPGETAVSTLSPAWPRQQMVPDLLRGLFLLLFFFITGLRSLSLSLLDHTTKRYSGDAQLKQRLDRFRPLPQTTIRLRHPEWSQRNAHLVGGVRG